MIRIHEVSNGIDGSHQVTVPCNTTADVYLPDGKVETVGSGDYHYSVEIPTR